MTNAQLFKIVKLTLITKDLPASDKDVMQTMGITCTTNSTQFRTSKAGVKLTRAVAAAKALSVTIEELIRND